MSAPQRQQPQITMRPVDSDHLEAVGHEPKSSTLQIAFKDSSVYQYYGVGAPVAQSLLAAKSKGQFFNRQIKGKFKSACVVPRPKKK